MNIYLSYFSSCKFNQQYYITVCLCLNNDMYIIEKSK